MATKQVIHTSEAPAAIGPYSQAIKANGFVFVSGQIAIDPTTNTWAGGNVTEQTHRVLTNASKILEAAGSSLDKAVQVQVFLKDMKDFVEMNTEYGKFFTQTPPARVACQAAALPKDALVEIMVTALA
eukprot:TRINITY_DN16973_c0_g1_i1.p2 TRINITY_DN16973_c0_g1~~TRINITY_DN16973_c0_g1_i1.p2  ORF type:complete len:139 (+),score=42.02 TRINITY_DN16973_c0_g1_i1:36-419(+)